MRGGSPFPPSSALSEIVTRLSQDPSSDVRSFVSFSSIVQGGIPEHSPVDETNGVPSVTTFSRPPPRRLNSGGMSALSLGSTDSLNDRRDAALLEGTSPVCRVSCPVHDEGR